MPRQLVRQASFGAGEFSPRAIGRTDLPQYAAGLSTLSNWVVAPQGSATRRPGFKHIKTCKTITFPSATERASATGAIDLNAVAFAAEIGTFGRWVAVGDDAGADSMIVYSDDDGVTWTAVSGADIPNDESLLAICWSGSLFVAVGLTGTIYTSPAGLVWTQQTSGTTLDLYAVIWTGTRFITGGGTASAGTGIILSSTDAVTWTSRDTPDYAIRALGANASVGLIIAAGEGQATLRQSTNGGTVWSSMTGPDTFRGHAVLASGSYFHLLGTYANYLFALVGPGDAVATVGNPAITALSSTRIAFIDGTNDTLRTYDFDGTNWAQVGPGNAVAGAGGPALATLSATRIALVDGAIDELRTYDFDGSDWAQVGNSLAISTVGSPALAALSSTRIAFIDSTNNSLRAYDFDGTDWAQVGSSLAFSASNWSLAALSSTRVALCSNSDPNTIGAYDFSGSSWAQVGNFGTISGVLVSALAKLSSTSVAFIDGANDSLRTYGFDGTDWAQVGSSLAVATVGTPALAALSSTRVAFIDSTNDTLRTYAFVASSPASPGGQIYRGTGNGTWTQKESDGSANTAYYAAGVLGAKLIAVGQGGQFASSIDDGGTWTEAAIETVALNGLGVNSTRAVIVGDDDATDAQLFTLALDTSHRRAYPFVGSTGEPYMMELGQAYLRFIRDGVYVESSPGVPYEVATPWDAADIDDLQFAQANDTMYITHSSYTPRKLVRTSETTFTLTNLLDPTTPTTNRYSTTYKLWDGPYLDENNTVTTLTLSTVGTGSKTLTASSSLFLATDVGRVVRVKGEFVWGWGVITGFTSVTAVTIYMVEDPNIATAVTRWALGAWCQTTGYPRCVVFYQQRLCFANTKHEPMRVWTSITADFEAFRPTELDDTVVPDNAVLFTIASRRMLPIKWLEVANELLAGTQGGVFRIDAGEGANAITPGDLRIRTASGYGACDVLPTTIGEIAIYAQQGQRIVRALSPNVTIDVLTQPDLTLLSEHFGKTGFTEMHFGSVPHSVAWMRRDDGLLVGLTLNPVTQILAWHEHELPGSLSGEDWPAVISMAILPLDGHDQLWIIVRRTINGAEIETVEAMQLPFDSLRDAQVDACYLDSAVYYSGASTTAISGLDHLEGEDVYAYADGIMQGPFTVASGAITLDTAASVVWTGLDYSALSDLETLPVKAVGANNALTRVVSTMVEVLDTNGLDIGISAATLAALSPSLQPSTWSAGTIKPLVTDDREHVLPGSHGTRVTVLMRASGALPATITGLVHTIEFDHV